MDYKRKKRNITYTSSSCKMYLRHDFDHRCAYCGSLEDALSPMPEVADQFFEKDHFIPQSNKNPDTNKYPNLFYSCTKCNGKKSNVLLTLNPCKDNILHGENPHLTGGTDERKFVFESSTPEGKKFISDLELNSRYHRRLRKKQHLWLLAKKEGVALLQDPRYAEKLSADDLEQIKNILSQGIVIDEYEEICGGSEHALDVVEACHFLEERGYNPQIILAENELDITATINGKTYCGSLRIEPSITYRIMKTEILAEQRKANMPVGLFVYTPDQDTLCFYEIDFDLVNWEQENHRLNNYIPL